MSKSHSYTFEVSETKTGVAVSRHKNGTIHVTVYVTQDEMNQMIDMMANEVLDERQRKRHCQAEKTTLPGRENDSRV